MNKQHGNRENQFIFQGSLAGVTDVLPGDGVTPSRPIAEHGGMLKFVQNVDVPAITAGSSVDWSITYAQYSSPKPGFDLVRYAEPLDTAKKLTSRGNFWFQKAVVLRGIGLTGAVQPTQAGGTVAIGIRTKGTLSSLWTFAGAIPGGQGVVVATFENPEGVYIGTDVGDDTIEISMSAAAANVVAGRYRVVLIGCEV